MVEGVSGAPFFLFLFFLLRLPPTPHSWDRVVTPKPHLFICPGATLRGHDWQHGEF